MADAARGDQRAGRRTANLPPGCPETDDDDGGEGVSDAAGFCASQAGIVQAPGQRRETPEAGIDIERCNLCQLLESMDFPGNLTGDPGEDVIEGP